MSKTPIPSINVAPIHLAPVHPDDLSTSRSPSLAHKDSFLSTFPGEPIEPKPQRRRRRISFHWPKWNWSTFETVVWAAVPLILHGLAIVLMIVVLLSNGDKMAFMTVREAGGTGKLQYYVLNSCAVAPGTTERICTPRSLYANFLPSLTMISPALPGFSSLKLPFYSHQTPSIMLTTLIVLVISLLIYLPLWTLVYFPNAPLPGPLVRFLRYRSRPLFYLTGALTFIAFTFSLSIGIGYKLYMLGFMDDFTNWYKFGVFRMGSKNLVWFAEIGKGFDAVWGASVCSALSVVSINISLHNGLDERVEWPKDAKESSYY